MIVRLLLILFCAITFQANALTTNGNQIIDANGNPIELKGVNWFGFNNSSTMTDGLWAGPDGLSLDFATVVYRLQLLGYNAVRIPFSFKDIYGLNPRDFRQQSAPASQSQIQANVTDPLVTVPPGATIPPQNSPPSILNPNVSNSYLPNDTTLNRFLWVINFFAKNGFYVLIDNHLREDQTVLQQGVNVWAQKWVDLVTEISKDSISKEKLMIDILNEPDNFGIRWEASGSTPGLKDLYIAAMDALYPINPRALFFVEGTGQGGIGANWGDGFATDQNLITQFGLSNPRPFFEAIMDKPYLDQIVISPHVYPPSVTGATANFTGTGLWNRMTNSFGYLTQQGYCNGVKCKIFPVAIGEFGSRFGDTKDVQSMTDIATYLNNTGGSADAKHQKIGNWFYWSWNANSGDTGGIVADDWRQIEWVKVRYLTTIELTPWYLASSQPVDFGKLCVSIAPTKGLTKEALKPINIGSYSFVIEDFDVPVCQKVPVGIYTVEAPEIIIGNKKFNAPAKTAIVEKEGSKVVKLKYAKTIIPAPTGAAVSVQMGTPWQEQQDGLYYNVINLYFTNAGTSPINAPWTITIKNSSYNDVSSFWNLSVDSIGNGTITATVSNDWQTLLPNNGNVINVGLIVSSSSPNLLPSEVAVNGTIAEITAQ